VSEPRCYTTLLAGRHLLTGWHEALIASLLAGRFDPLCQLTERFVPGSMSDFMAHRDEDRDGPLDDLEQRHHGEAGVPGDMLGTMRVSGRDTRARLGAPPFHTAYSPDTPVRGRCRQGRLGRPGR